MEMRNRKHLGIHRPPGHDTGRRGGAHENSYSVIVYIFYFENIVDGVLHILGYPGRSTIPHAGLVKASFDEDACPRWQGWCLERWNGFVPLDESLLELEDFLGASHIRTRVVA